MKKTFYKTIVFLFLFVAVASPESFSDNEAAVSMDGPMSIGIALGGSDEDMDLCPEGASVVGMFLESWRHGDYRAMYDLLDDDSKINYSFEQAEFDFRILPFTSYKISSVRKTGEDYEFLLSSGDWKTGDKELTKMIIDGKTFKVVMPTKNSPFKDSAESFF